MAMRGHRPTPLVTDEPGCFLIIMYRLLPSQPPNVTGNECFRSPFVADLALQPLGGHNNVLSCYLYNLHFVRV